MKLANLKSKHIAKAAQANASTKALLKSLLCRTEKKNKKISHASQKLNFNLILSSSYLIINYLALAFPYWTDKALKSSKIHDVIFLMLFIIAYGYLFLTIKKYFRKNNLQVLETLTLIIMTCEISSQVFVLINSFQFAIPEIIFNVLSIASIGAMIVWIVFVLKLKPNSDFTLSFLKKFAFGIIASVILGFIFSLTLLLLESSRYYDLRFLPLVIPYVIALIFALNIRTKKDLIGKFSNEQSF
jgi:hypothetical protein